MTAQTLTAAGFTPPPAPEPELAELWSRAIASDADRAHWLEQRRTRVTGTDAPLLARSRAQTIREHMRKKASGTESEFSGNRATEWGNYREAYAIRTLLGSGWHQCGLLIGAAVNDRITATPDLVAVNFAGEVELMERKTSAKDLNPAGKDFKATRYFEQILQQLLATGAERVRLVVEQHNDDWSRWKNRPGPGWEFDGGLELADFGPEVVATHEYVFERSDLTAELETLYEQNLAGLIVLDEELAGFIADGPETFSDVQRRVYGAQARKYADAHVAEKKAKEAKESARDELLALAAGWDAEELAEVDRAGDDLPTLAPRRAFSDSFDNIKVTFAAPSAGVESEVPDVEAAMKAAPELAARVVQAKAALTAAMDQWEAEQAKHTKKVMGSGSVAKVTVTPPKNWGLK
ncbi:hypothetical protein [Pseudomonas sp.]|uniref:hypothetical protein n=1 Tax=Pseudomonas sp. TaxID=306 RepID=UPI00263957DE|nr:hypothetical protein [Pseudomonas sp.]